MTILETPRLRLRVFRPDDLDDFAALEADPEVMKFYTGGPRTREHAARGVKWFIEMQAELGRSLWAVEEKASGRFLGYCGFFPQVIDGEPEIEIGYKLAKDVWGQGFATEAATAVRDWGFANLDVNHLISIIGPANIASIRVAEKNGMTHIKDAVYDGMTCRIYAVYRSNVGE